MTVGNHASFGSIGVVKKFLGLVLAIAIVVTATVTLFPAKPSNAATVNGAAISTKSLNEDLTAISANDGYSCYVTAAANQASGASLVGIDGATPRTFNTSFAAFWLSERISGLAAEQYVAEHNLKITNADLATASKNLALSISDAAVPSASNPSACPYNGAQVLAQMPKWFVAEQVKVQAAHEAILREVNSLSPVEAGKAYFAAHPEAFDTICLSAIVGQGQDIVHAQQAIEKGASFADAARQFSRNAEAAKGGGIGCFDPTSQSYAAVQNYVGNLSAGKTTPPFSPQQGVYALLHVDSRTHAADYAPLAPLAENLARGIAQQAASNAVSGGLSTATVVVNSFYGNWSTANKQYRVVPPSPTKA